MKSPRPTRTSTKSWPARATSPKWSTPCARSSTSRAELALAKAVSGSIVEARLAKFGGDHGERTILGAVFPRRAEPARVGGAVRRLWPVLSAPRGGGRPGDRLRHRLRIAGRG